jgi:hypothetical protein
VHARFVVICLADVWQASMVEELDIQCKDLGVVFGQPNSPFETFASLYGFVEEDR